jgi:hypothetical protein
MAPEAAPLIEGGAAAETVHHGRPADFMLIFSIDQDGTPAPGSDKKLNGKDVIDSIFVQKKEAKAVFNNFYTACGSESPTQVTAGQLRDAALKDFCEWLPKMGFTVATFKSIDEDELMMHITLDDPQAQEFYADKNNVHLQLDEKTVAAMGVTYTKDAVASLCTPPYCVYDQGFDADQCKTVFKDANLKSIFKTAFKLKNKEGSLLRQIDCIRIIRRAIMRLVDLEDMVKMGILVAKYPIHTLKPLDELRAEWAVFSCAKIFNPWSEQPLNRLRNYFGENVAFYFAFLGLTSRRLAILGVLGLLYKIASFFIHESLQLYGDLAWGLVMAVWSTAYITSWQRQEHALCVEWDMLEIADRAALRPDYRGEMLPNPLNTSENTKQFSPTWKFVYSIFSNVITVIFMSLSFMAILSARGLDMALKDQYGKLSKTITSVVIAVLIQVFNFIWSAIAKKLVELENPRTEQEYKRLTIYKLAPFSLFTAYNTFIWVGICQGYGAAHFGMTPCPGGKVAVGNETLSSVELRGDCITYLQTSVMTTFGSLGAMMLVGMAIPFLMLKYNAESEMKTYLKQHKEKTGTELTKPPPKSFMETQSKMQVYGVDEEIADSLTNITCIGYVLLFGGACPMSPFIALFVLLFQLRAHAYKLTRLLRRPYPSLSQGIGSWNEMLHMLSWIGIIFYVGIPIMNSKVLLEEEDQGIHGEEHRILLLFGAEHVLVLTKLFVWTMIPTEEPGALLLHARRNYVKDRLLLGVDDPEGLPSECKLPPATIDPQVLTTFTEKHPEWGTVDARIMNLSYCQKPKGLPDSKDLPADRDLMI